jgi:hypothetical protein
MTSTAIGSWTTSVEPPSGVPGAFTHSPSCPTTFMSSAESVPNLTRRLAAWLATDAKVRKRLESIEQEL